jgi:hypothetical protein
LIRHCSEGGALVNSAAAASQRHRLGQGNLSALRNGWILQGTTIAELAGKIREHTDNRELMDEALVQQVATGPLLHGARPHDFNAEPDTMGPVIKPPFFAIPLYRAAPIPRAAYAQMRSASTGLGR